MKNINLKFVTEDDESRLGTEDFFGMQLPKHRCSRCNALFYESSKSSFIETKIKGHKKIFCYECSKRLYDFLTETVENEFANYGQFGHRRER